MLNGPTRTPLGEVQSSLGWGGNTVQSPSIFFFRVFFLASDVATIRHPSPGRNGKAESAQSPVGWDSGFFGSRSRSPVSEADFQSRIVRGLHSHDLLHRAANWTWSSRLLSVDGPREPDICLSLPILGRAASFTRSGTSQAPVEPGL